MHRVVTNVRGFGVDISTLILRREFSYRKYYGKRKKPDFVPKDEKDKGSEFGTKDPIAMMRFLISQEKRQEEQSEKRRRFHVLLGAQRRDEKRRKKKEEDDLVKYIADGIIDFAGAIVNKFRATWYIHSKKGEGNEGKTTEYDIEGKIRRKRIAKHIKMDDPFFKPEALFFKIEAVFRALYKTIKGTAIPKYRDVHPFKDKDKKNKKNRN